MYTVIVINKKSGDIMSYSYILFDLDGTLTDPAEGITNSVIYALEKFGITPPQRSELYKFIGPPLIESFMKYYGFDKEKAPLAVEYYREHFKDIGIFENELIDGAAELLTELKEKGKRIILATSKPLVFASRILEHFKLAEYFDGVFGSNLDGSLTDKAEVIKKALFDSDITNLKATVMVGDRFHDIVGAAKNGIDSIGLLCGYGSKEELHTAGAKHIADNLYELKKYLI